MSAKRDGTLFIKNLNKFLVCEGITRNAFAKKIGFPSSTLYYYCKNNRLPSDKFISRFSSVYKEIDVDLFKKSAYVPEPKLNFIHDSICKEISYSLEIHQDKQYLNNNLRPTLKPVLLNLLHTSFLIPPAI